MTLFFALRRFHPFQQFFFGGSGTKWLFAGPMGIVFTVFWRVLALFGCTCRFVIHDPSFAADAALTRENSECTC